MATTKIRSSNQLWIDDVLNMGMSGSNLRIINLADPTGSTDAATKGYVDALKTGLDIKDSVRVATTEPLTVTATLSTLTNAGTQATFTIDTVTGMTVGNRILVKDQTDKSQNGIYTITNVGSPSTNWVLTRASDFDNTPGIEVTPGAFTFVEEGIVNADSGWVLTTDGTITIGTTPLTFTQFSGAGQIDAGNGLTKYGSRVDVVSTGLGSLNVTENSVNLAEITVSNTSSGSNNLLIDSITVDSYGRTTAVHKTDIGLIKFGSLNVTGMTTLGEVHAGIITGTTGTFSGAVTLNGGLTVNNGSSTILKGSTTIQGATIINNTLNVTGATTLGPVSAPTISTAVLTSTATTGTAPLVINSTTRVANLNADLLDGYHSYDLTGATLSSVYGKFVELTGDTMSGQLTIAAPSDGIGLMISGTSICASLERFSSSDGALTLYSGGLGIISLNTYNDQSFFLKPLAIGSDTTEGEMFKVAGNTVLSGNTNMTGSATIGNNLLVNGSATGTTFRSTIATGTAPLYVNSSTLVTNLNSDMIDGLHLIDLENRFVNVTGDTITGNLNISGDTNIGGNAIISGTLDVTDIAEFAGDAVFRGGDNQFYGGATFNNSASFGNLGLSSKGQIVSTITGSTAALVIPNTTKISNLNADFLDGYHSYDLTGTSVNGAMTLAYSKFVELTGDTMTGQLTLNGNGLNMTNGALEVLSLINNTTYGLIKLNSEGTTRAQISPNPIDRSYILDGLSIGIATGSDKFNVVGSTRLDGKVIVTGDLAVSGSTTSTTFTSTASNGTSPLIINSNTRVVNLNADMVDGYHITDLTNAFRKYRLNSSSANGTTVVFNYSGVNGGNITIDNTSFELFKNGLLMDAGGNDYSDTIVINTTAKTITFTVTDDIIAGTFTDKFLLNFSYTK